MIVSTAVVLELYLRATRHAVWVSIDESEGRNRSNRGVAVCSNEFLCCCCADVGDVVVEEQDEKVFEKVEEETEAQVIS